MSVHLEKCSNSSCTQVFEVERFSRAFGGWHATGLIECPHCGVCIPGNDELIYITRVIPGDWRNWPME